MSVEGDKRLAALQARVNAGVELKKGYPNGVRLLAQNYPQYKEDFDDYLDGIYGDNVKGLTDAEIDVIEARLFKAVPELKALEARYTGLEVNVGVDPAIITVKGEEHGKVVTVLKWFGLNNIFL